jgi:hypothetical protein
MRGDSEGVVSGNLEEVRDMPSFLEGTIVPAAIREIARLGDEVQEAKSALALAKESLAESFYDSFR